MTPLAPADDGKTDPADAIQAWIDAGRGMLTSPGLALNKPVYLDKPGQFLDGGRAGLKLVTSNHNRVGLVLGIPRVMADGSTVRPVHRPDAFGILDATAAPARHARAGIRTNAELAGCLPAHPMGLGSRVANGRYDSRWSDAKGFTLEFAATFPGGRPPNAGLLGLGNGVGIVDPWCLVSDGDQLVFQFRTTDQKRLAGQYQQFGIPARPADLHRVAVWVDFSNGSYGHRVNGKSTTVPAPELKGKALADNEAGTAFAFGYQGFAPPVNGGRVPDWTLWGLRVSKSARTADPVDDRARYFTLDPGTIAYLPLTDVAPARHVIATGEPGYDGCLFLLPTKAGAFSPVYDLTLANVELRDLDTLAGGVMRFRAEHCNFAGTWQGFGTVPTTTSYPFTFRDCRFGGNDAGLHLYHANRVVLDACDLVYGGSTFARFIGCCVDVNSCMVQFQGALVRSAVECRGDAYGGNYVFRSVSIDSEGGRGFLDAAFRLERHPYFTTSVLLDNCNAAFVGPGPFVRLVGDPMPRGTGPAVLRMEGCWAGDPKASAVVAEGPGWGGVADLTQFRGGGVEGPHAGGLKVTPPLKGEAD